MRAYGRLLGFWALLASGCMEFHEAELEPVPSGSARFDKYVAVGNSLTAGVQHGALYEEAQRYSYAALLARQMRVREFEMPLVSSPGLGNRLEVSRFDPITLTVNASQGQPKNAGLARPYDNLGIPGAVLADYLNADGGISSRSQQNPYYALVLRGASSMHALVSQLRPTLLTFWLGNNDVLGYVTSGGLRPFVPAAAFDALYRQTAAALKQTGASVVVANIPSVTAIPFVTYLNLSLEQAGQLVRDGTSYRLRTPQGNLPLFIQTAQGVRPMTTGDYLLLSAQAYLAGLDLARGDAVTPQRPIPTQFVLDAAELQTAAGLVAAYNQTIAREARANGFVLVDVFSEFERIVQQFSSSGGRAGITEDGILLRPIPGELFSFDGVHPSNLGHGLLANRFIAAINAAFGAQIPRVHLQTIPRGIPVAIGAR
ncbi:MAG: SGNH/GDSL hydrolase family protein [Bacteroidetes bacterium]|nr:SGNH/GDSL hydrolase family protein [Rhodothermia bacterium]MCS7154534.1 SGNH/GDSL hydrolase family protein [Bacteroidota bacterium]MCX7906251.1 SGNH/GDSL hydrolase family protein [Bacteroidota bacterium]MDW8137327.1 SGNH/GDSL hydrolase family protein [Bacteroidota bacterium]MDW8285719.1 SGNH/GDSL hydrolase family protein [Bacteroidota bacterium]